MKILLEALVKLKDTLNTKYIYINNNYDGEERADKITGLLESFERIELFYDDIEMEISKGNTELSLDARNMYFKKHELIQSEITELKIILRCIKNRNYVKQHRIRKQILKQNT